MKVFKYFLTLSVLMVAAASARAEVEIGKTAPSFALTDSNGKEVSLADYQGKTVVLEWTNHQCPFVRKHYASDNMQSLQEKYTQEGVVWLSVISSAPGTEGFVSGDEANKLTEKRDAHPTKVLLDPSGEVGRLYGAMTTPHMYIITSEGTLVYNGAIDSIRSADQADIAKADNYVDLGLQAVLSGKPVKTALTRPYGCSVKYES